MFRPTSGCIWNSFQSSGKRHLVITGGRGAGKTTLLWALCPEILPGVTTWAVPGEGVYLRDNPTGRTVPIGIFDPNLPGTEGKMRPVPEGFSGLGREALISAGEAPGEWASVDEIGYLESKAEDYLSALARLGERKRLILAVRKPDGALPEEIARDPFTLDLDRPYGSYGCVILASGLGKRFGGNKLTAPFRGKPLIHWALDATEGIFARRVVVTRSQEAAALCRERGVEVIFHDLSYRSDTVRLGVSQMEDLDGCLFCPADQPLLRRETVAALALGAVNGPEVILRPAFEDRPGAPVLFPKWAFPELKNLPQGTGGGYLARRYAHRVRFLPVEDPRELEDVDTREDLARLSLL